jgi:hypothetical protein
MSALVDDLLASEVNEHEDESIVPPTLPDVE